MRIFYTLFFLLLITTSAKSQGGGPSSGEVKVVKFYPNPAVSQITFDFKGTFDKSYTFQIFNFIGKKVYETQSIGSKTTIDLNDFYRGVFIFQVKDKTGKVVDTGKFQVAK